jgi:uncharacterized heparinase superfamily protein
MAVTVGYLSPVTGAVAPTALQAQSQLVRATVIATADGDTDAVITHNLGLSAAELALGRPDVILTSGYAEAAAARLSDWVVTALAANTVTVTKTTAGGSGAAGIQLHVTVLRPHSLIGN